MKNKFDLQNEIAGLLYDWMNDNNQNFVAFDCGALGIAYIYPDSTGWRVQWLPEPMQLPDEIKERMDVN